MLRPTARLLADQYTNDHIIWLATPRSIQADRLPPLAKHLGFSGKLHPVSCAGWADCIERGQVQDYHRLVQSFIDDHQAILVRDRVKILYGCTHYPLLDAIMRQKLCSVETINPAWSVAHDLRDSLSQRHMLSSEIKPSVHFLQNIVFSLPPRLVSTPS